MRQNGEKEMHRFRCGNNNNCGKAKKGENDCFTVHVFIANVPENSHQFYWISKFFQKCMQYISM